MKKDKLNDNLLFSCCCAKVDWSWTPVCDCHRGGWKCSQDCLEYSLITESLFYQIGTVSKARYSSSKTMAYPRNDTEPVQQLVVYLPSLRYMGHWSLARWCVGVITGCHIWRPGRHVRIPWRTHGCREVAPTITGTDDLSRHFPLRTHGHLLAFYSPRHPRLPHRRSCTNGNLQWYRLFVLYYWLRHGISVPSREDGCIRHRV